MKSKFDLAIFYLLFFANLCKAEWITKIVDSQISNGACSIKLDANNNPHIAYLGNDGLKYAKWTGTSWNIQTVE